MSDGEEPFPVVLKRIESKQEKIDRGEELSNKEIEQLKEDYKRFNNVMNAVAQSLANCYGEMIETMMEPLVELAEVMDNIDVDES